MSSSRYLVVGVVTRTSGRWTVRRRYRVWSPTRWALLALLERRPVRMLGFFAWHGVLRYPQLRWSKSPGPLNAAVLVALWIAIALIRDQLPAPARQRLLG
jgi:hypothetical protein